MTELIIYHCFHLMMFIGAAGAAGRTLRFLANVDPVDVARALAGLDAESTLVIIVSKVCILLFFLICMYASSFAFGVLSSIIFMKTTALSYVSIHVYNTYRHSQPLKPCSTHEP